MSVTEVNSNWLGRRVICTLAPKHAKRGYKGTGWIGEVYCDRGDRVRVAFKGTPALKWFHKSHLTLLKPYATGDQTRGSE